MGIQYSEKVLVLDIQSICWKRIGKSINTFSLEVQYPILFFIFNHFKQKAQQFLPKLDYTWLEHLKMLKTSLKNYWFNSNYDLWARKVWFWGKIAKNLPFSESKKYWVLEVFWYNSSGTLSIGHSLSIPTYSYYAHIGNFNNSAAINIMRVGYRVMHFLIILKILNWESAY